MIHKDQFENQRKAMSTLALLLLSLILLLGGFLRLYQLGAFSIGNAYYATTVKSMLTSPANFFFAAYEPFGSVTVDKPPFGFWVQSLFAAVLGINGFALALPQALAGIGSIFMVFVLLRKPFGDTAGLIAALALAVTPITVATERNNTIDGQLVFVLLIAAWCFIRAAERNRFSWLLLGGLLVGVGFNIKMLQAYMVMPAFFLIYFLGARLKWWKKLLHLFLTGIVILIISLSWALVVDAIPTDSRPYIGSSESNSVMELIIGHNGLSRILPRGKQLLTSALNTSDNTNNQSPRPGQPANKPQGQIPSNLPPKPPAGNQPFNDQTPETKPNNNEINMTSGENPGRQNETGEAGFFRLFEEPLVTQASWIIPFIVVGTIIACISIKWGWPLDNKAIAILLWLGWLLPSFVYFSFTTGLFHTYYLIMLGPPLAALFGICIWGFIQFYRKNKPISLIILALALFLSLLFQFNILNNYPEHIFPILITAIVLLFAGYLLAITHKILLNRIALILVVCGLLAAPFSWSLLTILNSNPNVPLPRAEPQTSETANIKMLETREQIEDQLIRYLQENTTEDQYLLAVSNANKASPFMLATDRAVFTFGGFTGSDPIIDAKGVAEMVKGGELRFMMFGDDFSRSNPDIYHWVQHACSVADFRLPGQLNTPGNRPNMDKQSEVLYDCAGATRK